MIYICIYTILVFFSFLNTIFYLKIQIRPRMDLGPDSPNLISDLYFNQIIDFLMVATQK